MHDSTADMDQTTRNMNGNMGHLKDSTAGLCAGSSQALPLQARQAALIQLDNQAVATPDKLSQAVTYIEAFDFQVSPLCSTDPDMVDRMLDDAALEFYQVLARYDSGSSLPNPLIESANAKTTAAKDAGFSVLAGAMHRMNRMQLDAHDKDPSLKIYSLLSITEKALLDGAKVDQGTLPLSSLKQYELDVLANKTLAIKVLQARQNFIAGAIVGFGKAVSPTDLSTLLSLARDRYISKITGHVFTWTFDISRFNVAQLAIYSDDLRLALETRQFLRAMGITPVIDPNLQALVAGMTVAQAAPHAGANIKGGVTSSAMVTAQQKFLTALNKLKGDI